jgi:hypothetical protein
MKSDTDPIGPTGRITCPGLQTTESNIHEAFADNINTPLIMELIQNLICSTNIYMDKNKSCINFNVIRQV